MLLMAHRPPRCALVLALTATLGMMSMPAAADNWRGWNIHPAGYPNSVAMKQFADQVTAGTHGDIRAKVYDNAILGDQSDAIEQVRNGALNFANFNMGPMGPIVPATNVLSLPFLFEDIEAMHTVMDGPIGVKFADALADKGLVVLAWFDSGARSLYNTKRPISTPDDLKGLKIRVMNNDLYVDMIDALGGNATPMSYGEVYQSLKTGVLDGAENNFPSYESSNHYEIAPYFSTTDHLILPECLCVAKTTWDAMSPEDQNVVQQAATDAGALQRKLWAERSETSREKVIAAGSKVNEIKDKAAFQNRMAPIYTEFTERYPQFASLIEEIKTAQSPQ
ncbi:TRAP transporter substrate-binding protein [Larsenimonas rhizosphaerae]|nr:TRAP transporter substrate-binding protein [Larsenimonas rhizosphaerae]MCM2130257.1 TRAP transporter substrate-binding protein [Larsenimonas rhizosphaerae]